MNASTSSSFTTLSHSLQINKISAESLTMSSKKPVHKNLFVTISTKENDSNDDYQSHNSHRNQQEMRTRICEEVYGVLVAWDEKFEMDVPMHVKFIVLEVCYATRSGNKSIGIANVPISDFVGGLLPRDYLHCLSYRLRDQDGNPNGIINFSVKVVNSKGFDYLKGGYQSNYNNSNMHYSNDNTLHVQKLGYGVSKDDYWRRNNGDHAVVGVPVAWYNK